MKNHIAPAISSKAATPPTTPPTIAPVLLPLLLLEAMAVGFGLEDDVPVTAAALSDEDGVLVIEAPLLVVEMEEDKDDKVEEEDADVDRELGFTFVTFPLTIQLPLPCAQQVVALRFLGPPLQHQDSSGHCTTCMSPAIRGSSQRSRSDENRR